jgi:hypothetical protein
MGESYGLELSRLQRSVLDMISGFPGYSTISFDIRCWDVLPGRRRAARRLSHGLATTQARRRTNDANRLLDSITRSQDTSQ